MTKKYWTVHEVMEIFEIDEGFISDLEREEIIRPVMTKGLSSKCFTAEDLEKFRFAKQLMDDMEVNLPGVEIILRMRQNMIDMRRQFDDILEDMARQIKETFG